MLLCHVFILYKTEPKITVTFDSCREQQPIKILKESLTTTDGPNTPTSSFL